MQASWKSQSKTFGRYTKHKGIKAHHYSKSLNNKGKEARVIQRNKGITK